MSYEKPTSAQCVLQDFTTESGYKFKQLPVYFESYGDNDGRPVLVMLPFFLGSEKAGGPKGHYGDLVGPGAPVDTNKYFVVSFAPLVDLRFGPHSPHPDRPEQAWGSSFPLLTIGDFVMAQRRVLREHFKLERVNALFGASLGSMQAIHWMFSDPSSFDRAVLIVSGSLVLRPNSRAIVDEMLAALESDPDWKNGDFTTVPARGYEAALRMFFASAMADLERAEADEKLAAAIDHPVRALAKQDCRVLAWQLRAAVSHDAASALFDREARSPNTGAKPFASEAGPAKKVLVLATAGDAILPFGAAQNLVDTLERLGAEARLDRLDKSHAAGLKSQGLKAKALAIGNLLSNDQLLAPLPKAKL